MKKILLIVLSFLFIVPVFGQQETLDEWTFCSEYKIMEYLNSGTIYTKVFENPDRPNADNAVSVAWGAFNYAFSLESLPVGAINEIFEPKALGSINDVMGHVGNSLALIQIASDYCKGDKLSAASNATKTSMFYIIGKWGWKSLKLAGVGMQAFDYMLTSFGQAAVSARQDALAGAYNKYYNSGMGKRNLTEWKSILKNLKSQEEVQQEIDHYLDKYFQADALDREISGGLYTDKEVAAVKKDYLNTFLLPYLEPLFLKLEEEAREEQTRAICDEYRKVIRKLNTKNEYQIHVNGTPDQLALCKVGIEVIKNGNKELFVMTALNGESDAGLSFTKYSLLANNISKARAAVRYQSQEGFKTLYKDIDLKQEKTDLSFDLPKEKSESEDVASEETPSNDAVSKDKSKPSESNGEITPLELTATMNAVFTANGTPIDIKIKKTKETASVYQATVIHAQFPKGNTLTIDKKTREMTFIYKLKGLFAPELICRGLPIAPNSYAGSILTNDGNNVNVGTFSLILLGK